jgi:hypothetical protein
MKYVEDFNYYDRRSEKKKQKYGTKLRLRQEFPVLLLTPSTPAVARPTTTTTTTTTTTLTCKFHSGGHSVLAIGMEHSGTGPYRCTIPDFIIIIIIIYE